MARNILMTSLSAAEQELTVKYYSLQKEFGFDYCDVLLEAEAGIKAMLARFKIDEIILIGGPGACDREDSQEPVSLRQGSSLYQDDRRSFSAYRLLRYRLARYLDEVDPEQEEEELLSAETRERLIRFIQEFREGSEELRTKKSNRLFDDLSQNTQCWDELREALPKAFPELRDQQGAVIRWIRSHLYRELKASCRLELLPVNEDTRIRFIPEELMEDSGRWLDRMMEMERSIVEDQEDIRLYIVLTSDDAGDTLFIVNMLDLMISMPESRVSLGRIFTLRSLHGNMSGIIRDDTGGFGVTELFPAIQAYLDYGRADRIVKLWEKNGDRNESVGRMVYALRHVDVGLSMCNIPEMEGGILRLRGLFRDEAFWREAGRYGIAFTMIAERIRKDYGALLEGDGDIPFIELVKWAYRHQFYQQTLTLIETGAPENLVRAGVFYYCGSEKQKEHVTELLARRRLELKPYEYYKMDEIDHYFIKTYNRSGIRGMGARDEDPQRLYAALRTSSLDNTDPSMITGLTACDSRETLQNLLFAYYRLGVVRNKISHADAAAMAEIRLMASDSDEISALVWMKDGIEYFISCYEKAMGEVRGREPQIVRITGEEVRIASERLKREKERV